jgi:hypothetical protein
MLKALALLTGLSMELFAQLHPPPILLIHRDLLKPGNEAAYREIEGDTARLMREAGPLTSEQQVQFPNPYLAVEPLTGPKEVWFLTGWNSAADYEQVGHEYSRKAPAPLVAALDSNSKKKAALTFQPISVFANYRPDVSRGEQWSVGRGRFLVITVTKLSGPFEGAVFETADHTRFVVMAAQTREEADAKALAAGPEAKVFAVRPYWTRPAREWVSPDPAFWQPWIPKTLP